MSGAEVTIDALLAIMLIDRLAGPGSYEERHASVADKLGRPEVAARLRALEEERRVLERPDLSVAAEIDVARIAEGMSRHIREVCALATEMRAPLERYLWAQIEREQAVTV